MNILLVGLLVLAGADDAELVEPLEAKGIKFDVPYHVDQKTGLKSAFLTDPQGTYIELTEGLNVL